MSSFALQPEYRDDHAGESLNMAFRLPRWRLRFGVHDLGFDLRAGDTPLSSAPDLYEIHADCAGSPVTIAAPAVLIDAILSRAPDPVSLSTLSGDDAGLMLEHLLSAAIEQAEGHLYDPIQLLRAERRVSAQRMGEILLTADVQGENFPIGLTITSPALREKINAMIGALDATGPTGIAGMKVAIGPVRLHPDDVAALDVGDQLLLDGASIERLQGGVFLDENFYWPIEIIDGGIQVSGRLTSTAALQDARGRASDVPVFFHVGLTGDASPMKQGDRLPLQRLDEKRMTLNVGRVVVGRGSLVNLPEGIAVRVIEKDAA